jgi:hypothetical protein
MSKPLNFFNVFNWSINQKESLSRTFKFDEIKCQRENWNSMRGFWTWKFNFYTN